jgi:hypothetical protein
MELSVLKGAASTLKRFQPSVFAECLSLHNGWQTVSLMRDNGFEAFLHNEPAFNPDNFRRNLTDFFRGARETNIVFVPQGRLPAFERRCTHFENLIPLRTLDDLALGMLKKPQYKYEALAPTTAAKILGIDFFANEPELRELETSLRDKTARVDSLQCQIRQIQGSTTGRAAARYQAAIGGLPQSVTPRLHHYYPVLAGIKVIRDEGWKSFFRKAWNRFAGTPAGK